MSHAIDLYDALQVSPQADAEVIQAAYKKLAAKYHPDRNPEPSAQDKIRQINNAYEVLSDPDRRREYDQRRANSSSSQQSTKGDDIETSGQSGSLLPRKASPLGMLLHAAWAFTGITIGIKLGGIWFYAMPFIFAAVQVSAKRSLDDWHRFSLAVKAMQSHMASKGMRKDEFQSMIVDEALGKTYNNTPFSLGGCIGSLGMWFAFVSSTITYGWLDGIIVGYVGGMAGYAFGLIVQKSMET